MKYILDNINNYTICTPSVPNNQIGNKRSMQIADA